MTPVLFCVAARARVSASPLAPRAASAAPRRSTATGRRAPRTRRSTRGAPSRAPPSQSAPAPAESARRTAITEASRCAAPPPRREGRVGERRGEEGRGVCEGPTRLEKVPPGSRGRHVQGPPDEGERADGPRPPRGSRAASGVRLRRADADGRRGVHPDPPKERLSLRTGGGGGAAACEVGVGAGQCAAGAGASVLAPAWGRARLPPWTAVGSRGSPPEHTGALRPLLQIRGAVRPALAAGPRSNN